MLGLEPLSLMTRKGRLRWLERMEHKNGNGWIKHYAIMKADRGDICLRKTRGLVLMRITGLSGVVRLFGEEESTVGWLVFNVPFQHKCGYIRDERSGVESYPYLVKEC